MSNNRHDVKFDHPPGVCHTTVTPPRAILQIIFHSIGNPVGRSRLTALDARHFICTPPLRQIQGMVISEDPYAVGVRRIVGQAEPYLPGGRVCMSMIPAYQPNAVSAFLFITKETTFA